MRNRSGTPPKLRDAYSRLHQQIERGSLIKGSVVMMRNTCGKKNCKCARGEPHQSLYLSQSINGKQRMMLIPQPLHEEARGMVGQYKKILDQIDRISTMEWERIKEVKKK